jgi:hypothetical protein
MPLLWAPLPVAGTVIATRLRTVIAAAPSRARPRHAATREAAARHSAAAKVAATAAAKVATTATSSTAATPPPPRPASVVIGAARVETRRQIPKTKSFELIIIDKGFMRLDTADRRSRIFFLRHKKKSAQLLGVSVDCRETETTGGSIPCDAMPPVK